MAQINLTDAANTMKTGKPVIKRYFDGYEGGRALNVTGFTPTVIPEGHVIIRETATGDFKPMPISGTAYAALPAGHEYVGVAVADVLTSFPSCAIMTNGTANPAASAYTITSILADFKTAVPQIEWRAD
jgi:hypothetical protein